MNRLQGTKKVQVAMHIFNEKEQRHSSKKGVFSYKKTDLLKFRNFGKKSLTELEDLIENNGLTFGMNVSKYKLEKE